MASHHARIWRMGLLILGLCGGLAAETASSPNGPDLTESKQPTKSEEKLGLPRPADDVPEGRKPRAKAPTQRDPQIEASLPQRPPSILPKEMNAVDLACALRLAGVENPDLLLARQRVARAAALRFLAWTFVLPNLNAGLNYDDHNGPVQ